MALTAARKKANAKYEAKAYDKTLIRLPKGRLDEIRAHIEPIGESLNGFIGRAISETMERYSGTAPEIAEKAAELTRGAGVVSLPSKALKAAQEAAETGVQPAPVDKVKAAEKLFGILGDLGAVDLDKARCERLGIVYLSPDTLEAAQQAAEAAGEGLPDFVARAVETQAQRDEIGRKMKGGKANE